jgi:hypothetical protein
LVPLLDQVKAWFVQEERLLLTNIADAIGTAAKQARAEYAFSPWQAEVDEWLQHTNLLFAIASTEKLRLLRVNGLDPILIEKASEPSVMVIPPPDVQASFVARVQERAQRKLDEIVQEADPQTRLGRALSEALLSVALFSLESDFVSPTVNCAFVTASGEAEMFEAEDLSDMLERFDWER